MRIEGQIETPPKLLPFPHGEIHDELACVWLSVPAGFRLAGARVYGRFAGGSELSRLSMTLTRVTVEQISDRVPWSEIDLVRGGDGPVGFPSAAEPYVIDCVPSSDPDARFKLTLWIRCFPGLVERSGAGRFVKFRGGPVSVEMSLLEASRTPRDSIAGSPIYALSEEQLSGIERRCRASLAELAALVAEVRRGRLEGGLRSRDERYGDLAGWAKYLREHAGEPGLVSEALELADAIDALRCDASLTSDQRILIERALAEGDDLALTARCRVLRYLLSTMDARVADDAAGREVESWALIPGKVSTVNDGCARPHSFRQWQQIRDEIFRALEIIGIGAVGATSPLWWAVETAATKVAEEELDSRSSLVFSGVYLGGSDDLKVLERLRAQEAHRFDGLGRNEDGNDVLGNIDLLDRLIGRFDASHRSRVRTHGAMSAALIAEGKVGDSRRLRDDLVFRTCQGCDDVVASKDLLDVTMHCNACRAKRGLPPRTGE